MTRRTLQLESQHPMTFDGLLAENWIIAMRNNVDVSYMKNMAPGVLYSFTFVQDGLGGHRFTWPDGCQNMCVVAPQPHSRTTQIAVANAEQNLYATMPGTWT